jgi:hypothetical protein
MCRARTNNPCLERSKKCFAFLTSGLICCLYPCQDENMKRIYLNLSRLALCSAVALLAAGAFAEDAPPPET